MSELFFASRVLKERIAPASIASNISVRIREASRALNWSFNRTKDVWYADVRVSIRPKELRKIEEVSGVKYGQTELNEVDELINSATQILQSKDAHIASSLVAALRSLLGAFDRPRA